EPAPPPSAPPMPPLPGPVTVPAPTPAITAEPAVPTPPAVAVAREPPPPSEAEPASAPPPPAPAPGPRDDADLVSPTLAELYLNQGFPEKAIEVYSRLLEREPGNERARARVTELREAGGARAETPPAGDTDQARAARREALERTIERLESLRAALQKGPR
ncbi:MAG TPA: tetratricopeptide repeat protein, partial [Vicinamibacteria bacterium]|nr:tetratricopeptide repeat protein [Vicinamibacteria bacterium]